MGKIDYKKELKHLYRPSAKEVVVVDVPPMQYLMVDGAGDPAVTVKHGLIGRCQHVAAHQGCCVHGHTCAHRADQIFHGFVQI